MTREDRLPSFLCHLSAQSSCLFLMLLCLMKSQSSSVLMAPYGTLCSEKYLNFTKQFSSQRFIIFVIFCIAISQILDQTVVFRSNVFRYS